MSECRLFWVHRGGMGIILGRWGRLGVYGALFWESTGEWGWVGHYFGWVGKYFGWVGVGALSDNAQLTQYLSNTCQIHCIYAIHGCKCSSKKYRIHRGIDGFVK